MRGLILFCLFIFVHSSEADDDISINDFAKGFELITDGQAAIYKLSLPEEVYRITTQDLSDIRVFNKNNEPVPHIIHGQNVYQTYVNETLDVPFFPVYEDLRSNWESELDITVSSDGKIVRFQSKDKDSQKLPEYYLIDVSHLDFPIESLELDIANSNAGYTKKIRLDYSEDLNHWSTLVNQATITKLDYGNHKLINTHIGLPNKKTKYIRLSWLDSVHDLIITGIRANLSQNRNHNQKTWSKASLVNLASNPVSYEFDTGGHFYIKQIDVELPEVNTLIDVTIRSRDDIQSKWYVRSQGIFYKLNIGDTQITSGPASVRPVKDRYWQLELKSEEGIGKVAPVFKYGWNSDKLYFLARGEGPFLLAYGNTNLSDRYTPPTSLKYLIQQDNKKEIVAEAELGQQLTIKGDSALEIHEKLPWQRILLWSILIIGVFITAYMVFHLIQQLEVK